MNCGEGLPAPQYSALGSASGCAALLTCFGIAVVCGAKHLFALKLLFDLLSQHDTYFLFCFALSQALALSAF